MSLVQMCTRHNQQVLGHQSVISNENLYELEPILESIKKTPQSITFYVSQAFYVILPLLQIHKSNTMTKIAETIHCTQQQPPRQVQKIRLHLVYDLYPGSSCPSSKFRINKWLCLHNSAKTFMFLNPTWLSEIGFNWLDAIFVVTCGDPSTDTPSYCWAKCL